MKKVCKCCGRNRRIGKFGKLSASSDGKNRYCRDCMRDYTKSYKNSPKGIVIQKKCVEKYEKKNKKVKKQYLKQYYLKNKKIILYNKRAREDTESILISENIEKSVKPKINKSIEICINPKRKK